MRIYLANIGNLFEKGRRVKKIKYVLYGVVLPTLFLLNVISWADIKMNLYVGQVKPISIGKVLRVAVGKDSILQTIVLDDGKVLFIPTGAGETDVKIWLKNGKYRSYKFNILEANIGSRKVIAQSLLRTFPGLRVKAVDKHIIIEGKISPIDQKVYQSVIGKIDNVISLVNPNKFNEYQIRQLLKAFSVEALQIKRAGKRFIVGGEIDPQDKNAFDAVISKIPNISSLIRPQKFVKERMVRLRVHVVEIDSSYGRQLGIKWDKESQGPTFGVLLPVRPNHSSTTLAPGTNESESNPKAFLGLQTSIFSRLNFLESNGYARTLSRPELLARSGTEASFNVGGQLPIVFTSNDGPQVTFKDYGVSVTMTPLVSRNNEIILKLAAEVSSVDTTVSVLGVPGLKTSKTSTTINAYDGRTVAISGLLDVTSGNDSAKVPYLGNVPVIGKLFKTKGQTYSKRELVFLITPELITPKNVNNTPIELREAVDQLEVFQVPLSRDIKGSAFFTDILE